MRRALAALLVLAASSGCGDKKRARARDEDGSPKEAPSASSAAGPGLGALLPGRRRAAPLLPLPAEEMPLLARAISRNFVRESLAAGLTLPVASVPREAIESFYAGFFCGFGNPFEALLSLRHPQQRELVTYALDHLEETRQQLACGRAIVEKLPAGEGVAGSVLFGGASLGFFGRVDTFVLGGGPTPLPSRYQDATNGANLEGTRCFVPPLHSACPTPFSGHANVKGTGLWLVGTAIDLGAFGLGVTKTPAARPADAKRLAALAEGLDASAPFLHAGDAEGFATVLSSAWFGLPPTPSVEDALLVQVVQEERGLWAMTIDGVFYPKTRLVLEAPTEAGAERIEKALEAWRARCARLAASPPPPPPAPPGAPAPTPSERAAEEAVRRTQQASAKAAKLERSGARVTLTVVLDPAAADRAATDALLAERKALAVHAVEAMKALAEGKRPPAETLEALGLAR